ncbi:hypothetical protein GCM10010255_12350 [Streptomyces coeruleofuscus]|uniref:Uncharacterized protein n=1 Tax=Streptomyces coeruleofuscus TaxID=66879 RepID=A0ABN3HRS1_9ACTN
MLRAAHVEPFFTDAPIAVFPVSWQDAGSWVFALAVAVWRTAWVHSLQNSHAALSDMHCSRGWLHCSPTSTSTDRAAPENWSVVGGGMPECHYGAAARS